MQLDRLLDRFRPGMRVYVPGSSGEPTALLAAWAGDPGRTAGLDIVSSLVPGINHFDPATLHPTARLSGQFMQPAFAQAQRTGQFRHLPPSYAGVLRDLAELPPVDIAIVQVSPPDAAGRCSLGPSVELTTAIASRAKQIAALVNARTPILPGAPTIALTGFAAWVEVDTPLMTYDTGIPDALTTAIAAHIAPFICDGAALQLGIGKVPAALAGALTDRSGLRIHTGLFSDGLQRLADTGALSRIYPHKATSVVGSTALYEWAAQSTLLRVLGCEHIHDAMQLAEVPGFIAVNSALEVDLFGQCNLEAMAGATISGAGGAPDFARAGKTSPHGLSIVALPAAAAKGQVSRIVAQIGPPGLVTLTRSDVDLIVTEYGVADLRSRSVHQRAERLIAIAAPEHRAALGHRWAAIARSL